MSMVFSLCMTRTKLLSASLIPFERNLIIQNQKISSTKWEFQVQNRYILLFLQPVFLFFGFLIPISIKRINLEKWLERGGYSIEKEAGIWMPHFWVPNFDLCSLRPPSRFRYGELFTIDSFSTKWYTLINRFLCIIFSVQTKSYYNI